MYWIIVQEPHFKYVAHKKQNVYVETIGMWL